MKQRKFNVCGICSGFVLLTVIYATTNGYAATIDHWVFDAAGGSSTSTGYTHLSVLAQPSPLGSATSTRYRNFPGFLHTIAASGNLLPDYTVTLTFSGTGTGSVTSSPIGLQCNTNCSAIFNAYTPVTLTPDADEFMNFTGWSGSCTGTTPCTLNLTGATPVTVTFEKDFAHAAFVPGILPGTGIYYTTLQAAYNAVSLGSAVKAWATTYQENLSCDQNKSVVLLGGYDQGYLTQTGFTILNGTLIFKQGTTTVERIIVK